MGSRAKRVVWGLLWIGRGTATVFGLALALALVLGVGTAALAAVPGDPFRLGKANVINNALSVLVGSRAGGAMLLVDNNSGAAGSRALDLRAEPGRAPLTVNADAGKAPGLDADKVDGKSAEQLGVNGLQRVVGNSTFDSLSPKTTTATCPAGKLVVGAGADITGAKRGPTGSIQTDAVIDNVTPDGDTLTVDANEEEPTDANWYVTAYALCATAP